VSNKPWRHKLPHLRGLVHPSIPSNLDSFYDSGSPSHESQARDWWIGSQKDPSQNTSLPDTAGDAGGGIVDRELQQHKQLLIRWPVPLCVLHTQFVSLRVLKPLRCRERKREMKRNSHWPLTSIVPGGLGHSKTHSRWKERLIPTSKPQYLRNQVDRLVLLLSHYGLPQCGSCNIQSINGGIENHSIEGHTTPRERSIWPLQRRKWRRRWCRPVERWHSEDKLWHIHKTEEWRRGRPRAGGSICSLNVFDPVRSLRKVDRKVRTCFVNVYVSSFSWICGKIQMDD